MTEHHLPVRATFKSGAGYDAPWLTVDAADPNDLSFKLDALLGGEALGKVISVAELFKAANNAGPLVQGVDPTPLQPAAPQQPAGWGNSAPQAQPQWSQPQQAAPAAPQVRLHPEGKTCACGQVLIFKEITSKKNNKTYQMWTCPSQQRKGDGHDSEFVN